MSVTASGDIGSMLRDTGCDAVFERALPYLQTRQNELHIEICFRFGVELLASEPGDPRKVLTAIILHDTGWSRVPEEEQIAAFGPDVKDRELTRVHEREGAEIAREILVRLGWEPAETEEIAEIVDGHDTRLASLSPEDSLVKDADKLFRFSRKGFYIDAERFRRIPADYLDWLEAQAGHWFFTGTGEALARREAAARRLELKGGRVNEQG